MNIVSQDEIARIRKRKRSRNMLNRSGNTTDNLCFRYRFRDVFSRFRCCVYKLCMLNITETWSCMFPPRFRNTETCDFVLCLFQFKFNARKIAPIT